MHIGHARTFWIAMQRAQKFAGVLIYRSDDLDRARCQPEFDVAAQRDLHDFGLRWQEGPGPGGSRGPYLQSKRQSIYLQYWKLLHATGLIYPCTLSRRDIKMALSAPHEIGGQAQEPVFPVDLRPPPEAGRDSLLPGNSNWRMRVPEDSLIEFYDLQAGRQAFRTGQDLGDFLVWRLDGLPSYEFAVVVDDHLMQITEVVRGADLLLSTARQILLYEALRWSPPAFLHVDLMLDDQGQRLSKRHAGLAIRSLLDQGFTPEAIRTQYF